MACARNMVTLILQKQNMFCILHLLLRQINSVFGKLRGYFVHSFTLLQKEEESFPVSPKTPITRIGYTAPSFAEDYSGIIDSTLASVYCHSAPFMVPGDLLYVTGGPCTSSAIMQRVAAIWRRQVIPIEKGGAALGAAVSGAYAFFVLNKHLNVADFCGAFVKKLTPINPTAEMIHAYHGPNGYLEQFLAVEAMVMAASKQKII